MPTPFVGHIPETVGEVMDLLGYMMLYSPMFKDGDFAYRNVDTIFYQLNEGLGRVRKKVGEERYQALMALSARMRAYFEADPKDETGDARAGRKLIREMEDILVPNRRK